MKQKITKLPLFLVGVLVIVSQIAISAQSLTGVITDASTGEKLVGANVIIGALNTGAASNSQGIYEITGISNGTYSVTVSFLGYSKITENIVVDGNTTADFALTSSSILMGETVVKGTRATLRETPIAFTEISGADLENRLSSRDIPMEMEAVVPSLYSSMSGGGQGDATLYVRGFSQRNIAIMINGVPVNDMENKWVYWSNWAGLGDVTESIQVQRGLGASPYSVNAIGGVINVQTTSVGSEEKYVKLKGQYGSNNLIKGSLAFHQKLSDKLSMTGLISRETYDGYADGTYLKMWTYYFSIGGVFGDHSIELTGVGSPQDHGQRPYYAKQTIAQWAAIGNNNYNYAQGRLHGGFILETINKYHKPAFNLNWNWQISDKSILSTVAYFSVGTGWGSGTLGSFAPRTADGYGDYDFVYNRNSTTINPTYSTTLHQSGTILRNSVNNHIWYGILSTYTTKLSNNLTLNTGIDGRYYIGDHYREVTDLLGGDYYLDNSNVNAPGTLAKVGDKVGYWDKVHVRQLGGFGQLEMKSGSVTTYLNVSTFTYGTKRIDYFLYTPGNQESAWTNFTGFTTKAGINYNLNAENNVYFNAGYFSTPPIVTTIYANNTNTLSQKLKNEKILGIEVGYGYNTNDFTLRLNGFYTQWTDRAFTTSVTDANNVTYNANVSGAKELHIGAELELSYKLMRNLIVNANGSILSAKYKNDVSAVIAPDNDPTSTKTVNAYVNGLYVSDGQGNYPMQRFSVDVDYRMNLGSGLSVNINPVAKYYGQLYAYFNPDARTNSADRSQPWQYPNYTLFDLHVMVNYALANQLIKNIVFGLHVFNLADKKDYIVEAQDGRNHDSLTSTVFYGRGRWINFDVGVNF